MRRRMVIDEFLNYLRYERNYSDYTVTAYGKDLQQFVSYIKELDSTLSFPEDIDADIIRRWIVWLMDNGYTSVSVNRKLSSLKSFFKYLVKQKRISVNPMRLVSGPKKKKPLPYFVKDADMEGMLDAEIENSGEDFRSVRDQLIVEMLYDTGMRRSELINLRDVDIDYYLMQIKVTGKRNKQRLIPFADGLKDLMQEYQRIRNREVGNYGFFFIRENGEQLYPQIVYRIVRDRLSEIPTLAKRSPHVLRHSFATSMLNNGAELNAVKDLLGHSSLASTSVYTHTSFEELKKVYHAHPRAKKEGGNYGN